MDYAFEVQQMFLKLRIWIIFSINEKMMVLLIYGTNLFYQQKPRLFSIGLFFVCKLSD